MQIPEKWLRELKVVTFKEGTKEWEGWDKKYSLYEPFFLLCENTF